MPLPGFPWRWTWDPDSAAQVSSAAQLRGWAVRREQDTAISPSTTDDVETASSEKEAAAYAVAAGCSKISPTTPLPRVPQVPRDTAANIWGTRGLCHNSCFDVLRLHVCAHVGETPTSCRTAKGDSVLHCLLLRPGAAWAGYLLCSRLSRAPWWDTCGKNLCLGCFACLQRTVHLQFLTLPSTRPAAAGSILSGNPGQPQPARLCCKVAP